MLRLTKAFVFFLLVMLVSCPVFSGSRGIVVGSKSSADHVVLAKALLFYLRIHSLPVVDKTNYGESMDLRRAILTGDIDIYFESLSTAWFNYFHKSAMVSSPDYLLGQCREADRQSGLWWSQYTPANRTFAVVMRKIDCKRLNIHSISAWISFLSRNNKKNYLLIPRELEQSESIVRGLFRHYGKKMNLKGKVSCKTLSVSHLVIPRLVANGAYFAGLSFAALGKLDYFELECLKDDFRYFPAYNLSAVARKSIIDKYVRLPFLVNVFSGKVTTDSLRRFDYLVTEMKEDPVRVAKAWLIDRNLVTLEQIEEFLAQ